MQSKPRVIKDFDKLDKDLQEKVLDAYPNGFIEYLISYTDPKTGMERFALPYETEDKYYMVRVDKLIESQIDNPDVDDDMKGDEDILNLGDIEKMDKPEGIEEEEEEEEDDTVDKIEFTDLDEVDKDEDDDEDVE